MPSTAERTRSQPSFDAPGLRDEIMRLRKVDNVTNLAYLALDYACLIAVIAGSIAFADIPRACRAILDHHSFDARPTLDGLWKVDAWARREVARWQRS